MESRDWSEAASGTCDSKTIECNESINLVDETQADGKIENGENEGDEETIDQVDIRCVCICLRGAAGDRR